MDNCGASGAVSPGDAWLACAPECKQAFLEGIVQGLNQGLRHCASEVSFALAMRLDNALKAESQLSVSSLLQQMRLWSKSGVVIFKYSRTLKDYVQILNGFYAKYPEFRNLDAAYLMIYLDDQHAMGVEELYMLHTHSLHNFKR